MPPGYYALVRFMRMFPGDPLVTLRVPSIVGYLMTLLGVYWFARKRLPAFAGLTAVLLTTLSPFREYALEARSYALLVGSLAISAVVWQRIGEKRLMTPLFALFLTLAVSSHYLAVVAISVFGAAELTRSLLSRRIRWWVWSTFPLATFPFFVSLPILLHFRDVFGKNFWSQPSWGMVMSTYGTYLGLGSTLELVLIALFGLVAGDSLLRMWRAPEDRALDERDFGPHEIVLVGGFLYFPILLVVLTKLMHSGYSPRYGWPAILGMVLGSVYLVRTIWLKPSSIYLLVALLFAFAYQSGEDVRWKLYKVPSSKVETRWSSVAELSHSEPSIPVVIGSPIAYLEAAEYAPPELRSRLVEVVDAGSATRLVESDTPDKTNRLLAQFLPLRVEDLAAFQAAHQKFLLYSGGRSYDWFTRYLLESGYHLRLLSKDADSSLYIVSTINGEIAP